MNRNFQPGVHPDADQLSAFVEGAAAAWEQERMLVHLADCGECRNAVFLMQPHEETQTAMARPEREWIWRRLLLPVGLPAAALACGLIAVLVYIRPHGGTIGTPQQIASVRRPEIERSGTTAAPATKSEPAPGSDSEQVARTERPKNFTPNATVPNLSQQESQVAGGLNLPKSKSEEASANVAVHGARGAAPSALVQSEDSALAGSISTTTVSELPLNGRNVTELQQLQPAGAKAAAVQNNLDKKKDLPALDIERASGKAETLAGVSGRITDPTGAIVAGATVTVRDAAGKVRQTTTGADGSFHLTQLPAGQYELTATSRGFKTNKQSIELKPSELAMLQPRLDVGTASEQVTVEAGAQIVQTESANVSGQSVAELPGVSRVIPLPLGLPVRATASHGKRFLSLDDAGNLFLSRNEGKKWKKIKPQWAGNAIRIELTPAYSSEAPPNARNETSAGAVFQLTTDAGAIWISKDGAHWHGQ